MDKALARLATSLALALALPPSAAGDEAAGAPVQAAEPARLAAHGLLIAIASSGERLVAVGDRGIIVLSDDHGASWRQAAEVPIQALPKNHLNQDLARYELHRVWVVDSKLKPGQSHLYSRRTLYVDEDSWQILAVDCYDTRGQLYRVQEGHAMNYYDLPSLWTTLELVMDLSNGRYLALGLQNEEPKSYAFNIKRSPDDYQPSMLERRGIR